ncbi:MAG: caspase family protein, partial [Proteobacteria bacterium]|nr:caspase family protein [Pseudomonadota bacterium]
KKLAEERRKADEIEKKKAAAAAEALRVESEKQAKQAEAERQKAEHIAALEATCKQEQTKLDDMTAKGNTASNIEDVRAFFKVVSCDRLRPQVVTLLDKLVDEAKKLAATQPNSPELVRAAQTQLARIGCFAGKVDGDMKTAKSAVDRYTAIKGNATSETAITEQFVAELTKQTDRLCPLECKPGQTAKGETCVADKKSSAPATASRHKRNDDEDEQPRHRKQVKRQAEREPVRQSRPAPAARQQAIARPSGEGGGGGSRTLIGVGF